MGIAVRTSRRPRAARARWPLRATRFDGLDVLVNNVGEARTSTAGGRRHRLDASFELNVLAVRAPYARGAAIRVRRTRRASSTWPSTSGKRPSTGMPDYSVTKAAVLSFSRLLACHAREGIIVNAVCPARRSRRRGWLRADWPTRTRSARGSDRETALAAVGGGRPLGRLAEPEEIASVIAFRCSARAGYVTGAAWSADGGTVPIII